MSRILAIDTSGELAVVAVAIDGRPYSEIAMRAGARHGETLLANVERALAQAGLGPGELDLVAVGLGPGSFTGVRIGVATAKGLCLAHSIPIVGVRTSRALARGAYGSVRVAVIDAHKGEVFVAAYAAGAPSGALRALLDETHGPPDAMGRVVREALGDREPILFGSGLVSHGERFCGALGTPHSLAAGAYDAPRGFLIAQEAAEALAERGADDLAALEPLYVRASDAVLPGAALHQAGRGR